MKKMNKKGFTLVEIMIVVAIIGLLAAIGIPAFQKNIKKTRNTAMENNARLVIAAFEQYSIENAYGGADAVAAEHLTAYLKGGFEGLKVGNNPASSIAVTPADVDGTGAIAKIAASLYSAYDN